MYRSSRTAIALVAAASTMPVVITVANAGEGGYGYSSLAQREMIRRQNAVVEGDRLLAEGREAYAKGDYQKAVDKYSQALQKVPDAPMFADRRASYIAHLSDASVALAMQHRKVGKYTEARALLDGVLAVDPNNAAASQELGYLDDPIRTNPALTYEHTKNVDKVRRTLYLAEGAYNLGKYDEAKREYDNVLRVDRYNTAARRGLERISQAKNDYYRAAYDSTRAELLSQVDAAWELSVPADAPEFGDLNINREGDSIGVAYISEKLRRIIIPRIDFEDTTVEEAIDFLRLRAAELDTLELDPAKKGVNFVVRRPRNNAGAGDGGLDAGLDAAGGDDALSFGAGDPGSLRISELRVRNVPLSVALKYICDATKLRYKVDDYAVTLVPQTESGEDIFTRTFSVPPDFSTSLDDGGGGGFVNVFGAVYSGQNSASLNIFNAPSSMDGYLYRVIITGNCTPADTSISALLNVSDRPEIVTQPSNAIICEDGSTLFGIDAGVTSGAAFVWEVDNGGGGGFNLSYGVWGVSSSGITFRVSCSYSVDERRGKVEKNLTTPWFETKNEDANGLSISLQWIKREPNKTSRGDVQ